MARDGYIHRIEPGEAGGPLLFAFHGTGADETQFLGLGGALMPQASVIAPRGDVCEHGAAPDEGVKKWQDRVNPVWKVLFGGCNLNRKMPALIEEGGFRIADLQSMYLPSTPRIAGFNYWGVAEA